MEIGDLLTQATCAVLDGRDSEQAIGTAWLAKDDGHLLTAGHVVEKFYAAGEVWVRFPDTDGPERAVFASPMPLKVDSKAAIDFAVLKLESPNGRTPLPFTLVTRAEGLVRVRGYPSSLPGAQSGGDGVLTSAGNYLREGQSWSYLFQYATTTLAIEGFSGGAVYGDASRAVIALQTGKDQSGRQAFAMPLARIADYWADMFAASVTPTRGLCVLIQPANSSAQEREIVRDRIVRPVVDQLNLALYVSDAEGMRAADLKQLELADVVIADVTYADPDVVYELTVAQGLGTPDVVVMDKNAEGRRSELFDIAELDLGDVETSRRVIEKRLLSVRSIFEALGEVATSNALTDFFRAPLTQISAANSLALGYATNFVLPVARALAEISAGWGAGSVRVGGEELSRERLKGITLTVVLPESLEWASDSFIDTRLAREGLVVPAMVTHPAWSRERTMKALPPVDDEPIRLLDVFPTTLSSMSESIDERFDLDRSKRVLDYWKALERKEIDRFQSKLQKRIRALANADIRDIARVATAHAVFPGLG